MRTQGWLAWMAGAAMIGAGISWFLPRLAVQPVYGDQPLTVLLARLEATDRAVRQQAEAALLAVGPEAVPVLRRVLHLRDTTLGTRLRAWTARFAPSLARVETPPARLREQAARLLARLGGPAAPAAPALVQRLRDPDPEVARVAGTALKRIGPTALPAVGIGLRDASPRVREAAAGLLAAREAFGDNVRDWRPDLIRLGDDPDPEVRRQSARTLGSLGPPDGSVLRVLSRLTTDAESRVREAAVIALGQQNAAARPARPAIELRLNDPDGQVRIRAAHAWWRVTGEVDRSLPVLTGALRETGLRWQAALVLGEMGTAAADAVPALLAAMPEEVVHRPARTPSSAALALARIGPAAVPGLVALLEHDEPGVRVSAAHALRSQGVHAVPAVDGLLRLLQADDSEVQVVACQALGSIGPAARSAIPELSRLAGEGNGYLRAAALTALAGIDNTGEGLSPDRHLPGRTP